MSEPKVTHGTFVIERTYPHSPQKVFSAFSDAAKKQRWYGDPKVSSGGIFEMDFRVGGKERSSYIMNGGPLPKGTVIWNETVYQDIVANSRIVFAYTMARGDKRFSASLSTIELIAVEEGTRLIVTDQGAYFEGSDGPNIREQGWRGLLEQLMKHLAG